ncbi:hypothetical protein ACHAXT_000182 [Thalassiosira profunda]
MTAAPNRSNSGASGSSHSGSGKGGGHQRERSNSNSHHHHHHQRHSSSHSHSNHRTPHSKKDLWKGSLHKPIGTAGVSVQMVGLDSPARTKRSVHESTVFARVDPNSGASPEALAAVTIGTVVDAMVTEGWQRMAKEILEKKVRVDTADHYPSAARLLELGAVWLLDETAYAKGDGAHARRLAPKDVDLCPEWADMTLRVHYVPERFFASLEVNWGKYCKGLILGDGASAVVGGRKATVPARGLPDSKDGVIVYEDDDLGFAVLNKPGSVPCYSTLSNHAEDASSMYSAALKERLGEDSHPFLSLPLRIEPEAHGLVLAATKKEFCSYLTKQVELAGKIDEGTNGEDQLIGGVNKTYQCLVCIKDPADIDRIEKLVGRVVEHYVDIRSPTPKKFVRNQPKHSNHEWGHCSLRILSVGQSKNFRAACVSSKFSDANEETLAHRLWGPTTEHPAEDLGVQYVMELSVQLLNGKARPHQIRGQLAALGVPIVGDAAYGGGTCEMRGHRHTWERMAVQVGRLEMGLPKVEEGEDGKRTLVPSDEVEGVFSLNAAWWSEYLADYERHIVVPGADVAAVGAEMAAVTVQ